MRLWQKIFLLTLCLTTLAANWISLMLLTRNQAGSLALAKERVRTICDGAVAELGHLIQEKKEEEGCLLVTESELESMFSRLYLEGDGGLAMGDAAPGGGRRSGVQEHQIIIKPIEDGKSVGNVRTMLLEEDGIWRIRMDTTAFWEGRFYRVEVSSDLSGLMERFQEDIRFSQWMSGAVSLTIAAVLLVSVLYLTGPLKRLETATGQIAAGEYGYRVRLRGHDEIAELSCNMNEMAAEIEASIRRAEELAKGRETFIANMAHELKTPLTSILGFADIMTIKSDMDETERREYAAIIAAEAKRLKLLSSRLMELISIEERLLELRPMDLGELTERALEIIAPVCAQRQCAVRRRLQPVTAEGDEALLTSLILNLLDNALKASAPGQEIAVTLKEREGSAVLTVRDHGIGIPETELGHVTEAFYMVDKARSRSSGGSGIGLALCKAIAEAHRGILRIESREGWGTRVSVTLPCADAGSAGGKGADKEAGEN